MTDNQFREVNSSDARHAAGEYGDVIACDPRDDGGWDLLVATPNGAEIVVSVAYGDDGDLDVFA